MVVNSAQKTLLSQLNVNLQSVGGQSQHGLGLVDHGGQLGLRSPDHHLLGKQTLQSSQGICLLGQPKPGQVIYISQFEKVEENIFSSCSYSGWLDSLVSFGSICIPGQPKPGQVLKQRHFIYIGELDHVEDHIFFCLSSSAPSL